MALHTTTGRWRLGFALSLTTALLWGVLPIALKLLLDDLDAYTTTWFRFVFAALLLFLFISKRAGTKTFRLAASAPLWLMVAVCLSLCGNYIVYLTGLNYINPSTATVVIQLAPLMLVLGGVLIYKERLWPLQKLGIGLLVIGLLLFFSDRIASLIENKGDYTHGILLIIVSGALWASYGLAQKQLLRHLSSETILLVIYLVGGLLFLPMINLPSLAGLSGFSIGLLLFCSLNTLFAYGAFAEALNHWEASRVSAVVAITPLLTIFCMWIGHIAFPKLFISEKLSLLNLAGAVIVVVGSMLGALGTNLGGSKSAQPK